MSSTRVPTPRLPGNVKRDADPETTRIAVGEYDWPDRKIERAAARQIFVQALGQFRPACIAALADKDVSEWLDYYKLPKWLKSWATAIKLNASILDGVTREAAQMAVEQARKEEGKKPTPLKGLPGFYDIEGDYADPVVVLDDTKSPVRPVLADPLAETRREFLRRAREHWDATCRNLEALGARPVGQKSNAIEAAQYLVRYQVPPVENDRDIADPSHDHPDPKAKIDHVRRLRTEFAALIELTQRSSGIKPGPAKHDQPG